MRGNFNIRNSNLNNRLIYLIVLLTFILGIGHFAFAQNSALADETSDLTVNINNTTASYDPNTYILNKTNPVISSINTVNGTVTEYKKTRYKVNVIATFPYSATDKQVVLSLAPGMEIVDTGATDSAVKDYLADEGVTRSGQTKVWADKSATLKDGETTYNFIDGTETVSIPITVYVTPITYLETVGSSSDPAIKIDLSYRNSGGQIETTNSVQVTSVNSKPAFPNFYPTTDYENFAATDTEEYMLISGKSDTSFKINHTANGIGRYYDYVYWDLSVDKDAVYKGLQTNSFGLPGNYIPENLGADPNNTENVIYRFKAEKVGVSNNVFNPIWEFPSSAFEDGDEIVVSTVKFVGKPWGNTEKTFVYQSGYADGTEISAGVYNENSLKGTHTFKIDIGSLVWVNSSNSTTLPDTERNGESSRNVYWRNEGFEDAIGTLGTYSFGNRKSHDSGPQEVVFHFDSKDIGVTALEVPLNGGSTLTEVWYKTIDKTEWTKATVDLTAETYSGGYKPLTDSSKLGLALITNDEVLGLEVDEYITDLKYVIPSVPAYGEIKSYQSALDFGGYIYGRALTAENKTVKSTIEVHDEGYDPTDSTSGSTTGIGTINTVLSNTRHNYSLTNATEQVKAPGSILTFGNSTIQGNTEAVTPYPVFYIRDETGLGIGGFSLTNKNGVNLVDKYGIEPELIRTEADGTLVYKVDTSVLKEATGTDKYDAMIGHYQYSSNPKHESGSSRQLTIKYNVMIPSNYRDGSVEHKHEDRIYITSATPAYSIVRYVGTQDRDTYDVDGNGITAEGGKYYANTGTATGSGPFYQIYSNNAGFYKIAMDPDLTIVTESKHEKAPESSYSIWEEGAEYLQVNVGEGTFQVRTTISNDAGADISDAVIYQPIPKKGQFWGELSKAYDAEGNLLTEYPWSVYLQNEIVNPDPEEFDIYYGVVTPTDNGTTLNSYTDFVPFDEVTDLSKVNCIKIVQKSGHSITDGESFKFVMNCNVDEDDLTDESEFSVDIARTLYYRAYEKEGLPYSGWRKGTYTAVQLSNGKISGSVYFDENQNGIVDSGEDIFRELKGATLKLYKKSQPNLVVQQDVVSDEGTYSFSDLLRERGEYILEIIRPDGLEEKYIFSVTNKTIGADGNTNNLFEPSGDGKSASAEDLYAVKLPGSRDAGITEGGNGVYNILIMDKSTKVLTVNKTVTGNAGDKTKDFSFRMELKDKDGNEINGTFPYNGISTGEVAAPEDGTLTVEDGIGTFKLKHGQGIEITGLPNNCQYAITETADTERDGYVITQSNASSTDLSQNTTAAFENCRKSVTAAVTGQKELSGGGKSTEDIKAGQFKFNVTRTDNLDYAVDGLPSEAVSVNAGGDLDFGSWKFYREGIYTFKVSEQQPPAGYTKAEDVTVTVTVTENPTSGELEANIAYSSGTDLTFMNTYTEPDPTKVKVSANKIVSGDTPKKDEEFIFVLESKGNDDYMPEDSVGSKKEVTVTGAGEVNFGEISFDKEGTYNYTVEEAEGNAQGYKYDDTVYRLKIHVSFNEETNQFDVKTEIGKGLLGFFSAKNMTFENVYTSPDDLEPDDPKDPDDNDGTDKSKKSQKSIKTGDNVNMLIIIFIATAALTVCVLMMMWDRKDKIPGKK